MELKETFERVKKASKSLALLTDAQRNDVLNAVAEESSGGYRQRHA